MQLSKRLQAVADCVTPGRRVADVGCDHAYTSINLAQRQLSPYIIAMDVNQGPVDRAKENIIKYHCEDQIEVRKSNGLEKLKPEEAEAIIIAGMGGSLMVQILAQYPDVIKPMKELILQPQSEIYKVRQLLKELAFIITYENMIYEDGKYYVIIKAEPCEDYDNQSSYQLTKKEHFYFGRLLLEQKNSLLKEFLLCEFRLYSDILRTLSVEKSDHARNRRMEMEEKLDLIKSALEYFETVSSPRK